MASADLFNLTQSNQKQFSDNNTMELSLRDLKLFGGLDGINGINSSHDGGGDEMLAANSAVTDASFTCKSLTDAFNNDSLNATEMVASATGSSECSVSETSSDLKNVLLTDETTIAPNASASMMIGSDESGVLMDSSSAKCEEPTSDSFESQLASNIQLNVANNADGGGEGSGQSEDSSCSESIGFGSSLSCSAVNGTILLNTGNVRGNICAGVIHDLTDCALEDPNSLDNDDEPECKICKSALEVPRVLACLHVVCEACLETLLIQEAGDTRNCAVACPVCKQETTIDSRGAAGLHLDYTVKNTVDLNNVEPHAIACTSCKSKEQAMSRCIDCANFLCACCDNAHKYMRCFENHAVVLLSELRDSCEKILIHKPLFCNVHPSELLKFYCYSCQTVACNDCLVAVHKGSDHRCDLIAEAETSIRTDLQEMVDSARAKITHCDSAAGNLGNTLTELQQQHDNARDSIETTFERCSAILESCREGSLRDLQHLHAERELYIMDALHSVEKSVEKIKTTCRFAQKILTDGNGAELLSLQNLINRQVYQVMQMEPKVERNVEFAFEGKIERFELLAKDAFGRFQSDSSALTNNVKSIDTATSAAGNIPQELASAPKLTGMLPMLSKSSGPVKAGLCVKSVCQNRPYDNPQSTFTGAQTASSPILIPVSMQSYDGEILTSNFFMSNGGSGGGGVETVGNGDDLSPMQHLRHVQLSHQQTNHQLLPNVDMNKRDSQQIGCNSLIASSAVSVQSAICNGTSLAVMSNVNSNNLSTALVNSSLSGIGSVGNALNNGLNGAAGGQLTPPINNISGLSSIAEYNLHRLANLVESNQVGVNSIVEHHQQHHHHNHPHHQLHNLEENVIATLGSGSVNGNSVNNVTGGVGNASFTLTDLINGDQRAFSQNLHALAKLNMNNVAGVGHLSSNVLNRGTSPSGVGGIVDNGSLLNDFIGMPGNTSPIGTISSSLGDDMGAGSAGALSNLTAAMNLAGRTKATPMQIRCKFGSLGASKAQFNSPHGFCLGVEEEIIVADTNNHRIQVFEKIGTFKFQFGVPGKEEGQLWYPRKVAVMRTSGKFVVCDRGNERSRMQIFTKNGHFIKKIAIRYIDIVAGLAVTNQGHIVAVDSVSPTVFIIAEDGNLVHWFDCSDYMREPSDIAISGSDFYVCDFKGHNVAVFSENGTFLHRIGDEKITCFPNGIDISDAGDILIGDSHGNRFHVACFSREGVLQSEFECPYVKVSRCCGLKITSEGYVVTLAKNNHHVLVLNTLYIH